MAATGPQYQVGAGAGGTAARPPALVVCISAAAQGPGMTQQTAVSAQSCVQAERVSGESGHHKNAAHLRRDAERGWQNPAAPLQTAGPAATPDNASAAREAPRSFRSPESVEMDEIMAAMVLTSLSCSPLVQSPPQAEPGPADMECGGGELSDSGSSGYWSWDRGNVSPTPSPSVIEMDSSPDEGLHMDLEQGEELNAKKPRGSFRGAYRCLWPSCGKVLTSSVGMKRHIRVLHLGSRFDQSQREEDFYYTKISCEGTDAGSAPAPSQQALGQASSSHLSWTPCGSPPGPGLQIPPAHRPRSNSSSGLGASKPSPLSQSAPSSFWQIHSEHLYQACGPAQVPVAPNPGCQGWTPAASVPGASTAPMVKPRCRSVSVGEQWLQQNRLQPVSASPSRNHWTFKKGRGDAKKCRKVYGVERKDQWCTACRWKKACQRFPD